jgi:hypothetical protein
MKREYWNQLSSHGLTSKEGFSIAHERMNQMMFEKHKFKISLSRRSYV